MLTGNNVTTQREGRRYVILPVLMNTIPCTRALGLDIYKYRITLAAIADDSCSGAAQNIILFFLVSVHSASVLAPSHIFQILHTIFLYLQAFLQQYICNAKSLNTIHRSSAYSIRLRSQEILSFKSMESNFRWTRFFQ